MSGLFSKASGSNPTGKGGVAQTVDVPPFISTGGITPEQQTLAQYGLGQDLLAQRNLFANAGEGASTMATQATGGAENKMALEQGGMSDTDQQAQYALYKNDVSALASQLQNAATLNQAGSQVLNTDLSSLAKLVGFGGNAAGAATV